MRKPGPRSLASRITRKPNSPRNSAPEAEIQLEPLVRHKHVEKILDVSPNTVDRLIREEGLPVVRLGGSVRFDLSAVRAWIARKQSEEKATVESVKQEAQ